MEQLCAIIKELKMMGFGNLRQGQELDLLQQRIKILPSCEQIMNFEEKVLKKEIGEIMKEIDNLNIQNKSSKVIYIQKTGLQPLHRTLDWSMEKTASSDRQVVASTSRRDMVRIAKMVKNTDISSEIELMAAKMLNGDVVEVEEVEDVAEKLFETGDSENARELLRTAAFWKSPMEKMKKTRDKEYQGAKNQLLKAYEKIRNDIGTVYNQFQEIQKEFNMKIPDNEKADISLLLNALRNMYYFGDKKNADINFEWASDDGNTEKAFDENNKFQERPSVPQEKTQNTMLPPLPTQTPSDTSPNETNEQLKKDVQGNVEEIPPVFEQKKNNTEVTDISKTQQTPMDTQTGQTKPAEIKDARQESEEKWKLLASGTQFYANIVIKDVSHKVIVQKSQNQGINPNDPSIDIFNVNKEKNGKRTKLRTTKYSILAEMEAQGLFKLFQTPTKTPTK